MKSNKNIGLYIHIPWCIQKCPYCDFNSHAMKSATNEQAYVASLVQDLQSDVSMIAVGDDVEIDSIFFGGGTPSTFSAAAIGNILEAVDQQLTLTADCEITLEANPGASEQARFEGYRAAGVNRLSIGIQSFNAKQLKTLGRVHSSDEAERAIRMARKAGFRNINLDMMFALPGQSLSAAQQDLQRLIEAEPEHISYYQLTIEPNTYFYAHPPQIPDDDLQADIQLQGQNLLAAAGYAQYEISAYAREGRMCRHNLHYWQFDDYLGIGAGAHGKWTAADGDISRRWKHKQPQQYQQSIAQHGQAIGNIESIAADRQVFEYLLNRLRLYRPITFREMADKISGWSAMVGEVKGKLVQQEQVGLIRWLDEHAEGEALGFELTAQGRLFVNQILLDFLPA